MESTEIIVKDCNFKQIKDKIHLSMINLWCKEHCESHFKLHYECLNQKMTVKITFNSDDDHLMFKLAFPLSFLN